MENNLVITINREFGSGGRIVGEELANRLQIKLVDGEILTEAAKVMNVTEDYLKQFEEKAPKLWSGINQHCGMFQGMSIPYYQESIRNNDLYITQSGIIKELAMRNSCVFIGRCANDILKDEPKCVRIFLHGDIDFRKKNIMEVYGFKKSEHIEKEINKIDKQREEYYRMYTQNKWKDFSQYDLVIDTGKIGLQETVDLIITYLKIKNLISWK